MGFGYNPLAAGIEEIRSSWGWFLALGILFVLLGAVCVIGDVGATFATVLVFGWMLLFSGIFGLVHAFRTHSLAGLSAVSAQRTVPGLRGISADPVSARWGSHTHSGPCFLIHCRRSLSRHWGRNVEVPELGLGCVFRNCFAGAGDHAAGANAHFERLVHRFRHWRGSDLRRGLDDQFCYGPPQTHRGRTREGRLNLTQQVPRSMRDFERRMSWKKCL